MTLKFLNFNKKNICIIVNFMQYATAAATITFYSSIKMITITFIIFNESHFNFKVFKSFVNVLFRKSKFLFC